MFVTRKSNKIHHRLFLSFSKMSIRAFQNIFAWFRYFECQMCYKVLSVQTWELSEGDKQVHFHDVVW